MFQLKFPSRIPYLSRWALNRKVERMDRHYDAAQYKAELEAHLNRLRSCATLPFDGKIFVNPGYTGPNPYQGPEVTDGDEMYKRHKMVQIMEPDLTTSQALHDMEAIEGISWEDVWYFLDIRGPQEARARARRARQCQ